MWIFLEKLGIPKDVHVVNLVSSFHKDMKARVRIDSELLEEI